MRRSDSSLAAVLLVQHLVGTDAAPLRASEYWSLLDRVGDPASLLGLDRAGTAAALHADDAEADRIVDLLGAATALAFELGEMEQSGLRVLCSIDDEYPAPLLERLANAAPPVLYVAGDPALMTGSLLGVVGSRDVAGEGAEVARDVAREAARHGVGVVSGGARGVDRLAMQAAREAGATSVGVPADSLTRTLREVEVRRAITDGQLCLCTPYKPSAGFSVANAMGRNKIIYGLSQATLVVDAHADTGGTWSGAVEAMRHRYAPVIAWTGAGAGTGNAKLVALGASPLDAIEDLFPLAERPPTDDVGPAQQLSLEV